MSTIDLNQKTVLDFVESSADDFEYDGEDLEAMDAAENYPKWIVEEFSQFLIGDVADVGAGCGNFSRFLLGAPLRSLHAFEPSKRMYDRLVQRFPGDGRFRAVRGYVADMAEEYASRFDAVVYNNVMEHVQDDEAELRAVYRMLKPGGRVLIYVPALSWLYSDYDKSLGHFRRYSKLSGCDLLTKSGFSVEVAKYADVLGVLPWLLCMKVFKGKLSRGSVSFYDKVGVPLTRAIEKRVSAPLGKNLLLVGRKDWLN